MHGVKWADFAGYGWLNFRFDVTNRILVNKQSVRQSTYFFLPLIFQNHDTLRFQMKHMTVLKVTRLPKCLK